MAETTILYHGTNNEFADEIVSNRVDTGKGSGELGKGFYTGDLLFRALNWAFWKYESNRCTVEIEIHENDFIALDPLLLNKTEAIDHRNTIKSADATSTFLFNRNAIWAPVVGKEFENYQQVKFEAITSQSLLNGTKVIKRKITK